jgi:NAD(P)-dependent dehydrogenase (short-subunit alcohol dehydrogenase family)
LSARQVAVVTGASAGIGKETARLLLARGWQVIGVGRDPERTRTAESELRGAAPEGARLDLVRGDFTEMGEVRRVADEIKALAPRLDVLVNNAGGVRDALYRTSEGLEATMAANHFAPFVLTRELLPLLRRTAAESPPGTVRVIAVSSSGHQVCPGMNWDDLNMFDSFSTGGVYCQAKLANLLFTRELARRVADDGIVAQAMHPGRVASNFASHGDAQMQAYMAANEAIPASEPAETLAWLATDPEGGREPGRYFHAKAAVDPAPQALDDEAAARLWVETERILAAIEH